MGTLPKLEADAFGPIVSYCRVNAAGIAAEWVETTVATNGQPTIVYFVSDGYGGDALEQCRPTARHLALASGARVFTVDCSAQGSRAVAVQRGIAAYAWLLGEGCDGDLTTFAHESTGASLVEALLMAAKREGLPLPAAIHPQQRRW